MDPREAVIVLLVLDDSLELAREVLAALAGEVAMEEVPRPDGLGGDWLLGEIGHAEPGAGEERESG